MNMIESEPWPIAVHLKRNLRLYHTIGLLSKDVIPVKFVYSGIGVVIKNKLLTVTDRLCQTLFIEIS